MNDHAQSKNPAMVRHDRVRDAMRRVGMDFLFLNYGADFTYVSGIVEPDYYWISKTRGDWVMGLLVSLDRDPILILTRGFAVKVEERTWIRDVRVLPTDVEPDEFLAGIVREVGISSRTIGLGKSVWSQTALSLRAAAPDATFVPATNAFTDKIREVKDPDEIALMERASEITDAAMEAVVRQMRVGMTERELAIEVDYQLRLHGGDKPSFYPGIICVGNGSDPARDIMECNLDLALNPGMTVAFDWGVSYHGYTSDFGRTAFIGEPQPEALAAYRATTDLNQTLMAEMKAGGLSPAEIRLRAVEIMNAAGWADYYMPMDLGHAIGLDVHENPWHRPGFNEPIQTNMCFTLEPKIWKPGEYYVRSEDVVVISPSGARSLTKFHYEPIVIS